MVSYGIVGVVLTLLLPRYKLCDDNVYYIVPTILCMMGLLAVIFSKHWPSCLITSSFALFALHVPFLYFFEAWLKLLHCYHFTMTGWGMVTEFVFCIVIIILVINTMRKKFPKIIKICFQGR